MLLEDELKLYKTKKGTKERIEREGNRMQEEYKKDKLYQKKIEKNIKIFMKNKIMINIILKKIMKNTLLKMIQKIII